MTNHQRTVDHDVVTKNDTKIFQVTFAKRKRVEDYESIPFGYKRQHMNNTLLP